MLALLRTNQLIEILVQHSALLIEREEDKLKLSQFTQVSFLLQTKDWFQNKILCLRLILCLFEMGANSLCERSFCKTYILLLAKINVHSADVIVVYKKSMPVFQLSKYYYYITT